VALSAEESTAATAHPVAGDLPAGALFGLFAAPHRCSACVCPGQR